MLNLGRRTCSRCSEWESVSDTLRRKDDKIREFEEEIRSLKTAKDELERLKKDVNEEGSNTVGGQYHRHNLFSREKL